ncbi:hypothetical protein [Nocardia asteroides]|uniref:hypothetical protein n=1 Tax=Nocardia asteroides TaxID=1824 RepID=UPI001E384EBA|nr:hypothetical protein [Nocardia asteroides]UGT64336.1 hypothetical protein LTT61_14050 [Nocardia asteroides]
MYGLWRTCQHFAEADSIPDATASAGDTVLAAAPTLPRQGRKQQFLARLDGRRWEAVGFVVDGNLRDTSAAQLRKYEAVRAGHMKWSNDSYAPLRPADHPQRTVDLDA